MTLLSPYVAITLRVVAGEAHRDSEAVTACLTVSNPWPDLRGPRWGGTRTPPGSLTEGLQEHFGDPSVRVFPDQTAGAGPTSTSRARSYREAGAPRTGDVFRH